MSTSNTAKTIYERVASVLGDETGQMPINFTATNGATTSAASTTAEWGKSSSTAYNGLFLTVTRDGGGAAAAPEGESHVVTAYTNSTNTLTAGTYTAAIASTDSLSLTPLPKSALFESINDVISTLPLPRYIAASLIADGNMESATAAATDWPDVNGTPTQTKETSIVLTGTQSLKIVTTTVDHSVGPAANTPVTEGEQLVVWAPVKCTAGSLRVQLYDVTNAAEIHGATVDEEAWTTVYFTATVPDNCQNVTVRLISKTASTTAYVDHVGLLSQDRTMYDLPSQITDGSRLIRPVLLNLGRSSEAADSWTWSGDFDEVALERYWRDYVGVTSHRVELCRIWWPLFWEFEATGTRIAAMADLIYAPLELVVEGAVAGCFKRMGNEREATKHSLIYRTMLGDKSLNTPTFRFHAQHRVGASDR